QVYPATQEQPALALHQLPKAPTLSKELRSPHFIDGLIRVLHHVELVVYDPAVRRPLLDAQPEWFPHVYARRCDPHLLAGAQLLPEELIQRFLLSLPSEP